MIQEQTFLFLIVWLIAVSSLVCSSMIFYWMYASLKRHFGPKFPKTMIVVNLFGVFIAFIILFCYDQI